MQIPPLSCFATLKASERGHSRVAKQEDFLYHFVLIHQCLQSALVISVGNESLFKVILLAFLLPVIEMLMKGAH